ncbi:hypothetical protein B5Z70_09315, partial [Campylobacter jejuni]
MFISSKTELIQTIKNLTINNKEVKQIDFINTLKKLVNPLAVIRDHFITYPFAINSKFISFDLKKIFYGIDLCTGVFDTHFS